MRNFPRALLSNLATALFLFITAVGVAKALSQFQKSIHCDTAYHNLAAVNTKTPAEFFDMVGSTAQPSLEYALRRLIFVPLFGDHERTVRIPDLLCWILILLLVPILTLKALKKDSTQRDGLVVISTLFVSLWAASNQLLTQYAVVGRHYEWCALISLLWFSAYNQPAYFKSKGFHVLSFVYLNSHFFVWPLVGSAYLYQAISISKEKRNKKQLLVCLGLPATLFLISAVANWKAIHTLAIGDSYTSVVESKVITKGIGGSIFSGFSLVRMFRSAFEIKYAFLTLFFIGAGILRGNKKLLLSLGVFLLSLIAIKSSSGFTFVPRYLIPFFGLAWFLVVEGTRGWLDFIARVDLINVAILPGACAFVIWFYQLSPRETLLAAASKGIPQKNFTEEFYEFEKIRNLDVSSIVIGSGGYVYMTTLWHLRDQARESPKVKALSQDWLDTKTWKKSWTEFKQKQPTGKTFVHFYNPGQCDNANPRIFHELKRFSEGCIGEVVGADSVGELEEVFLGSRG